MADSRPALEVASEYGVMLLCGPDYENKGKIISCRKGPPKSGEWGGGGQHSPEKFCHVKKIILNEMYGRK